MSGVKVIRLNELPIEFWDFKCRDCQMFKEEKAKFIKDWNGILRLDCEKLGNLRVKEWYFKIRNCPFFKP